MQHIETTGISRRNLLRSGALFGAGALLSGSAMAHAATAASKLRWSNVAGLIDSYVAQRRVANMVAAIGMGQHPANFLDNGVLTLGRMQQAGPDSLYRIYSMTKPITGMAAMMLIEEGKLSLDQPISDILPKFADMQVQKTYDGSLTDLEPASRPITIRHLLTHTAGLGYSIIQKGPIKAAYEAAGLVPGQVTRLPLDELFGGGKPVDSLEKFADRLAEMPLVYQPGTRWSYSVGLDLMGRIIEVVSGQPFDAFLQERFFDPLGMTSTFFRVPLSEAHRLTTNYGVMGKMIIPIDPARRSIYLDQPAFPFGGAGLVSSPRDYDRFLRMLGGYGKFNDIRIMGEEAVRIGTSNLLPEGVPPSTGLLKIEAFGAGGFVGTGARKGTFGWGGAAGTTAFVDMRSGLRAGLFTQFMPAEAYPVSSDFLTALQKDIAAMQGA
jgi:CubicO group peptidase (beta-lactamase class C family)